jgi:hypothetical protein
MVTLGFPGVGLIALLGQPLTVLVTGAVVGVEPAPVLVVPVLVPQDASKMEIMRTSGIIIKDDRRQMIWKVFLWLARIAWPAVLIDVRMITTPYE